MRQRWRLIMRLLNLMHPSNSNPIEMTINEMLITKTKQIRKTWHLKENKANSQILWLPLHKITATPNASSLQHHHIYWFWLSQQQLKDSWMVGTRNGVGAHSSRATIIPHFQWDNFLAGGCSVTSPPISPHFFINPFWVLLETEISLVCAVSSSDWLHRSLFYFIL